MTMNTEAPKVDFAFHKRNYLLLLGGILIVVIGYMLMSGGGSDDPGVFAGTYTLTATDIQAEIFSSRRISVAPVVVLFGYGFILYGIMSKGAGTKEPEVLKA